MTSAAETPNFIDLADHQAIKAQLTSGGPMLVTGSKYCGKSVASRHIEPVAHSYSVLDIPGPFGVGQDLERLQEVVASWRGGGAPPLVFLSHQHHDYFKRRDPSIFDEFSVRIDLRMAHAEAVRLLDLLRVREPTRKMLLSATVLQYKDPGHRQYKTYVPKLLVFHATKAASVSSEDELATLARDFNEINRRYENFSKLMELELAGPMSLALWDVGTHILSTAGGFWMTGLPIIGAVAAFGCWKYSRGKEDSPVAALVAARSAWNGLGDAERDFVCYSIERHARPNRDPLEPGDTRAYLSELFAEKTLEAESDRLKELAHGQEYQEAYNAGLHALDERFGPELDKLRGDLAHVGYDVDRLRDELERLSESTAEQKAQIRRMEATMAAMARLSERQAAQIQELAGRVRQVVAGVPLSDSGLGKLVPSSGWFWVADPPALVNVVDDAVLVAFSSDNYELLPLEALGREAVTRRIVRDVDGWHCSSHPQSGASSPCWDLALVLAATQGGTRIREDFELTESDIVVGVPMADDDGEHADMEGEEKD